ncbi:potassium transporter TrkG [Oricola cellulosilytica]|uniref:TrkH family potassium uptake protein n=1 Tax=Oricola cellulosilytica TaxID=1429082 RepID=A0A4R0PAZ7_9HYPH|nr:potassium transporter TrkG [Oricola cellulosilytica]TCD13148.1 TrkH family potassium uptake protein [Oricola cellulosilytica]
MRTVILLLAFASAMFLASLVAPILIGLAYGETEQVVRLTVIGSVGVFIAGVCIAATMGYRHGLTHTRLILTMVLVWLGMTILGAIPLSVAGEMPFGAAYFESVSGLTTTGASVLSGRESLPRAILFWRLQLEWIGGFLTLATLFLVLSPMAIGGVPRRTSAAEWQMELTGDRDAGMEHLKRYFPLLTYYCAASVLVYFAFVASGADSLDSAYLTMTGISTGGFNPYETEFEARYGRATLVVMACVLAVSATSLLWQRYELSNPFRRVMQNREAWWVFLFIAILTGCYIVAFGSVSGARSWLTTTSITDSFLAAASVISTSGHEPRPGVIELLPEVFVFSLAFVGAGVFSTASGLKVHRLGAMLVQCYRELSLLIYPSSVIPTRIAKARYDERIIIESWPVLVLLLAVMAVALFALSGGAGGFEASMLSAMALLLNAGPLYEAYAPVAATGETWPSFREFTAFEQGVSCVIMILGRLEFVAVFAILNLKYWVSR